MKKIFGFPFAAFKEMSSQIPHVYQPSSDSSSSSMSSNPSIFTGATADISINIERAAVHMQWMLEEGASSVHLLRPGISLGRVDTNTSGLHLPNSEEFLN